MVKEIAGAIGGVVLAMGLIVVTLVPSLLVYGYVLSCLWAWFMVPQFGLPALSLVSAIGVSLVTTYMSSGRRNGREIEKEFKGWAYFNNYVAYYFILPLVLLGIGYILKGFL